jgi:VIT1/CCC1 family predicted Fe2+/Mn2+ transporter
VALDAHPDEPHDSRLGQRLNWLRAGVLGANDGIVSTAGVVIGVAAAAQDDLTAIATAGIAALVAGAFSMAGGEYVSVSTQRDTEQAMVTREMSELREQPEVELEELAGFYRSRGLSSDLAHRVAAELTEHDALAAHAEVELGIDPSALTSPWIAASSSFLAFTIGSLLPLVMILVPIGDRRIWGCRARRRDRPVPDGMDQRSPGWRATSARDHPQRRDRRGDHARHLCHRSARRQRRRLSAQTGRRRHSQLARHGQTPGQKRP